MRGVSAGFEEEATGIQAGSFPFCPLAPQRKRAPAPAPAPRRETAPERSFFFLPRGVRANAITLHPSDFKFSPVHMELSSGKTKSYKNIIPFCVSGRGGGGAGETGLGGGLGEEGGQFTGQPRSWGRRARGLLGSQTRAPTSSSPAPHNSVSKQPGPELQRSVPSPAPPRPDLPWVRTALRAKLTLR